MRSWAFVWLKTSLSQVIDSNFISFCFQFVCGMSEWIQLWKQCAYENVITVVEGTSRETEWEGAGGLTNEWKFHNSIHGAGKIIIIGRRVSFMAEKEDFVEGVSPRFL